MCRKYEIVVQLPSSSAHAGALVVSVDAGSRKIIAMVQRERRIERIRAIVSSTKQKKQLTYIFLAPRDHGSTTQLKQ
jgi:glycine/D-amino acid oxidase-like deaminating enzyme